MLTGASVGTPSIRNAAPTTLELDLDLDAAEDPAPLQLMLRPAGTYAGVVELAAQPQLVRAARLRLVGSAVDVVVHDLFVLSYG